jgi:hypothetical protein
LGASAGQLEIDLLSEHFAVVRLGPESGIPEWATSSSLFSVTRTPDELSITCPEAVLPASVAGTRGFRCLRVRGPLAFSEVGILESLARPLARAGVGILALSTCDTDYLLVAHDSIESAVSALTMSGHVVHGWPPA